MAETITRVDDDGNVVTVEFADAFQKSAYEQLVGFIEKRNGYVSQANAVQGNREDLVNSLTENSDDPEIVAARTARDEAVMRLHALVTPKVAEIMENGESNLAETQAKIKELDESIRPGVNFYKSLYGDDAAKHLPSRVSVKGGASRAGGGKRIRGYNVIVKIDDEETEFPNVASAAKFLEADTALLQEKFFETAGNPKSMKEAPNTVTFDVAFTDVDDDGNETESVAVVTCYREVKQEAEAPAEAEAEADEDEDGYGSR